MLKVKIVCRLLKKKKNNLKVEVFLSKVQIIVSANLDISLSMIYASFSTYSSSSLVDPKSH